MTGRERLRAALAGEGLAFAPIVWERLAELVRQPAADWWAEPALAQRLLADAAALACADAMFVFVAHEAVARAAAAGALGDDVIDGLARGADAARGAELVACVHDVAGHGLIAAVPAPAAMSRALHGQEPEPAQDAFSDLATSYLQAGADALAVTGEDEDEVAAGLERAGHLGELFGRPVLALHQHDGEVRGWTRTGAPLGIVSPAGEWPRLGQGVVTTPGDVSGRWSVDQLRAAGSARP